jgi:hypothetical protein
LHLSVIDFLDNPICIVLCIEMDDAEELCHRRDSKTALDQFFSSCRHDPSSHGSQNQLSGLWLPFFFQQKQIKCILCTKDTLGLDSWETCAYWFTKQDLFPSVLWSKCVKVTGRPVRTGTVSILWSPLLISLVLRIMLKLNRWPSIMCKMEKWETKDQNHVIHITIKNDHKAMQEILVSQMTVAHAYNSSYSGGWNHEIWGSRPAQAGVQEIPSPISTNSWAQWGTPVIPRSRGSQVQASWGWGGGTQEFARPPSQWEKAGVCGGVCLSSQVQQKA